MPGAANKQPAPPFLLGANFPWVDCGHDFGPRPPSYGHAPRDWARLARDLADLRALGITVVRWWLLAGGVNYPVGVSLEDVAEAQRDRSGRVVEWRLRGERPPLLPQAFLDDFARLCEACGAAGVRLLPSLVSFELFDRFNVRSGGGGRRQFVFGRRARDLSTSIDAFLEATLMPLLRVSDARSIYAWELVNEPDWVVKGGAGRPLGLLSPVAQRVSRAQMNAFIRAGTERIAQAGFMASVGFHHGRAPWLSHETWGLLRALADQGRYVHQHHHYPTVHGSWRLPDARSFAVQPCLLGEFPTGRAPSFKNVPWPLPSELRADAYLYGRWREAKRRGYVGALAWSTQPDWLQERARQRRGSAMHDSRVQWSHAQREQTRHFARDHAISLTVVP